MSEFTETSLSDLDPERRERGYWRGFRARTLAMAGPELARRRELARLTVSDVVASWSRVVVPAALAAAVAGALMLGDGTTPAEPGEPAVVEELLDAGTEAAPVLVGSGAPDDETILAAEPF